MCTKNISMRDGWTIIELSIVIILIGILASIAIGKLSVTRDDAKLSADVSNMGSCLRNVAAVYTATEINDINLSSCNSVQCYTININGSSMNVDINTSAPSFCDDVENVGGHLLGTYQFAGQSIKR